MYFFMVFGCPLWEFLSEDLLESSWTVGHSAYFPGKCATVLVAHEYSLSFNTLLSSLVTAKLFYKIARLRKLREQILMT